MRGPPPLVLRGAASDPPAGLETAPRQSEAPASGLYLDWDGERLRLVRAGAPPVAVEVDFLRGPEAWRLRRPDARGEPLARAAGLRGARTAPRILDAGAGLGRDAALLASLGCRVEAWERSPVLAALLADGLRRAAAGGLGWPHRLELHRGDARPRLRRLACAALEERPEVVYLDPMHPPRRGSARVRKEMALLQELLGPATAEEEAELLELALAAARERVVVKRPLQGPPLAGRAPDHARRGRRARFDLYRPGNLDADGG